MAFAALRGIIDTLLKVGVVLVGEGRVGGDSELVLVLGHELLVDDDLGRRKGGGGDKLERLVADELASEPEEGLLEVVVGLGRDLEVLEVL
jgi:hypothetical protein